MVRPVLLKEEGAAVAEAVGLVLVGGYKTVVVFLKPLSRVKRRIRVARHGKTDTMSVTIGRPNYAERLFLKQCKKAKCKPRRLWFPGAK